MGDNYGNYVHFFERDCKKIIFNDRHRLEKTPKGYRGGSLEAFSAIKDCDGASRSERCESSGLLKCRNRGVYF